MPQPCALPDLLLLAVACSQQCRQLCLVGVSSCKHPSLTSTRASLLSAPHAMALWPFGVHASLLLFHPENTCNTRSLTPYENRGHLPLSVCLDGVWFLFRRDRRTPCESASLHQVRLCPVHPTFRLQKGTLLPPVHHSHAGEAIYMKMVVKKPGLDMDYEMSELDLSYPERYQVCMTQCFYFRCEKIGNIFEFRSIDASRNKREA